MDKYRAITCTVCGITKDLCVFQDRDPVTKTGVCSKCAEPAPFNTSPTEDMYYRQHGVDLAANQRMLSTHW